MDKRQTIYLCKKRNEARNELPARKISVKSDIARNLSGDAAKKVVTICNKNHKYYFLIVMRKQQQPQNQTIRLGTKWKQFT